MSRPAVANFRWLAVLVLGAVLAAQGARAERAVYDIYVLGVKAGELEIASTRNGRQYALAGRLESTGMLSAIRRVRYGAETKGRISGGRFVPDVYSESTDTGQRRNSARMEYRRGVPQVKTYSPARDPKPEDVDPTTQAGTLDPLTALFSILRDAPRAAICDAAERVFDGRRATELRTQPVAGDPSRCRGVYRRVAGYDAEELAERREFPFEVTVTPAGGDRVRVTEIVMRSLYGRARVVRR